MKAYHIDSAARTIEAVEYSGLADLQRMVGGYIEAAVYWPSGDVLFVDSDGMLRGDAPFFRIKDRPDQPLAGNGVVVGPEIGDTANTRAPSLTLEALRASVTFLSVEQVRAWGKANASEPAATVTMIEGAREEQTVLVRYGEMIKEATRTPPPLTDEHVMDTCYPGKVRCCRYLAMGVAGWRCLKLTSLRDVLDSRVAEGTIRAVGDNCDGRSDP